MNFTQTLETAEVEGAGLGWFGGLQEAVGQPLHHLQLGPDGPPGGHHQHQSAQVMRNVKNYMNLQQENRLLISLL